AAAAGTFPRGQFFTNGQGNGGNGQGGNGGQGGPGGFAGAGVFTIRGTVSAVTADSVTIKTAAGAEITVSTSGDTAYHQQAAAASGDVKSGSTVLVRVDGFRGRFGGGGPGSSPAASGAPRTNATATDITVVPELEPEGCISSSSRMTSGSPGRCGGSSKRIATSSTSRRTA